MAGMNIHCHFRTTLLWEETKVHPEIANRLTHNYLAGVRVLLLFAFLPNPAFLQNPELLLTGDPFPWGRNRCSIPGVSWDRIIVLVTALHALWTGIPIMTATGNIGIIISGPKTPMRTFLACALGGQPSV